MSGPHIMKFRVVASPHWQRTIHGGHAVMKCRSHGEGIMALRRKACQKHETYVEVQFIEAQPEKTSYEYESRAPWGRWSKMGTTLPMPSRNVARRVVKSLSKTMKVPLRLKPGENSMNKNVCAPPYVGGVRVDPVPFPPGLSPRDLIGGLDAGMMPQTTKFGEVVAGDEIVVKLKVTHSGIPGAVAGVKIGPAVLAFTEDEVVEIKRAPKPLTVGDKVIWRGHYAAKLLGVDGEDAFIRAESSNTATACLYRDLVAA